MLHSIDLYLTLPCFELVSHNRVLAMIWTIAVLLTSLLPYAFAVGCTSSCTVNRLWGRKGTTAGVVIDVERAHCSMESCFFGREEKSFISMLSRVVAVSSRTKRLWPKYREEKREKQALRMRTEENGCR